MARLFKFMAGVSLSTVGICNFSLALLTVIKGPLYMLFTPKYQCQWLRL